MVELAFYLDLGIRGEEVEIFIPLGSSAKEIAEKLEEEGLISQNRFLAFFFLFKSDDRLLPGRYSFRIGESVNQIVGKLIRGPQSLVKVTFPEGFSSEQMGEVLEAEKICSKEEYLALVQKPQLFNREYLRSFDSLEGVLFPDTYFFPSPYSAREVIEAQLSRFEQVVIPHFPQKENLSLFEIVTLASIVEKEAKLPEEKATVASVFINRLNQNMRLQSCATVVYAIYQEEGKKVTTLTNKDLEIDSPFNTYIVKGLPPQPICNPGWDSIQAVLEPDQTDYLYFVLNEEQGKHVFSRTYQEHLNHKNGGDW
ncbi:MAG: hypothetical protein PWP04_642 [Candidatus Atribacteria bacterium]|nr:hypothetical protein [Candidatus Atribacteria bacterium]